LQIQGDKIFYVWEELDGKYRQIWTAIMNKDGTDPQFQIIGKKVYYVWHEDHGPIEFIWVAVGTITE